MDDLRPGHDRLTMRAEFVWWYAPHDAEDMARLEDGDHEVLKQGLAELTAGALEAAPRYDAAYTGMGRGADGPAIAVAFLAVTAALGYINNWLDAAERIAQLWRAVRRRRQPPKLSLGALTMLCVCDLHRRLGDVTDVQLAWAGDLGPGAGERGFSGEDLYGVLFARAGDLWVFVVDDVGQVVHFGEGAQQPHAALRAVIGSTEWVEDAPALPDNILLPDDASDLGGE